MYQPLLTCLLAPTLQKRPPFVPAHRLALVNRFPALGTAGIVRLD